MRIDLDFLINYTNTNNHPKIRQEYGCWTPSWRFTVSGFGVTHKINGGCWAHQEKSPFKRGEDPELIFEMNNWNYTDVRINTVNKAGEEVATFVKATTDYKNLDQISKI